MHSKPKRVKPKPLYKSPTRIVQAFFDSMGRTYRRRNALRIIVPMKPHPEPYQYATAQNVTPQGRKFLDTFTGRTVIKRGKHFSVEIHSNTHAAVESKNTLVLVDKKSMAVNGSVIARIGLGFDEEAVIMEVIQGRKKGNQQRMEYVSLVKENWTTNMVKMIEEHAKRCGLQVAKIRRPETLYAYQLQGKKVQEQIRTLYYSIAKARGYKTQGAFFVKRL